MPECAIPKKTFSESEVQKIIDIELIASYIEEPILDHEIKAFERKQDGSLEKYLIFLQGKTTCYYVARNTNYDMRVVYDNMQELRDALPEHIPRPVAYVDETEAVITEGVEGKNFLEQFSQLSEPERLEVFRKTGEAIRKMHSIPAERLNTEANQYTSTLEGIMNSINRNNLEIIEQDDLLFAERLKQLYEIITNHESRLQKERKPSVIHGDLHPGNVFVSSDSNIIFPDMDDVTLSSQERDIGTFLEQTDSILREQRGFASIEGVKRYQQAFLEGCGCEDNDTVTFYQAWIAWRNAMYFRSRKEPDIAMAQKSLESVKRHLRKAELLDKRPKKT